MKKIIGLILVFGAAFLLNACENSPSPDISMYDLSRAMLDAAEFQEMSYVSSADNTPEDLFANVSDLSYSKVDSFFIAYASNAKGNADEIVVIALKKQTDVSEAVASLTRHLSARQSIYATYDPTQSKKLENATVLSKDNFAVLIVSDDSRSVYTAFESFLKNGAQE